MSKEDRSRGLSDPSGRSSRSVVSQTTQLIDRARDLSENLRLKYARWSVHQRRGESACEIVAYVNKLLELYDQVNQNMIDDFHNEDVLLNKIGDSGSPLFGSAMDILPFSELDSWVAIRSRVSNFCVQARASRTARRNSPRATPAQQPTPIAQPTTPVTPQTTPRPRPVQLPSEDEIIERIDRFFAHNGLRARSFFSDGHDTLAFSRMSLIVINLFRVITEQPLIVCSNFNTQANKDLARSTRYFFNRTLRHYGVNREQIARRMADALFRGIPIWLERYSNTANPAALREARTQLESLNLCGDTLPVFEAQFDTPARGHERLGG